MGKRMEEHGEERSVQVGSIGEADKAVRGNRVAVAHPENTGFYWKDVGGNEGGC